MNLITGMVLDVDFPVFIGSFRSAKFSHKVRCRIEIIKDKYTPSGQHNFTFKVIESTDCGEYCVDSVYRKFGRNMYPNVIEVIKEPYNCAELEEEKAERRKQMRDDRVFQKKCKTGLGF